MGVVKTTITTLCRSGKKHADTHATVSSKCEMNARHVAAAAAAGGAARRARIISIKHKYQLGAGHAKLFSAND